MGWKLSSIIVSPAADKSIPEILDALGFDIIREIDPEPYESAMYASGNILYIGYYNHNLILSYKGATVTTFQDDIVSDIENKLSALFPGAEIGTFLLQSNVNCWGFSITRDGKKIRVKAGDAISGTTLDRGEPLEQEMELLARSSINEKGNRIYILKDGGEAFSEDQVGENIVFELFKRYTGNSLDSDDHLLFESEFKGYEFSDRAVVAGKKMTSDVKPWWKFW